MKRSFIKKFLLMFFCMLAFVFSNSDKAYADLAADTIVSSEFNFPVAVAVDSTGNVYIADSMNNAIKKWDKASGVITTIVSSGLNYPTGVAVDSAGNVYISDALNNMVKKWDKESGIVTTLVSSGLYFPSALTVDSTGNVYIADTFNNVIKKWDKASGIVTTIASGLYNPAGLAVDSTGNVYIADTRNNAIKKWDKESKTITTILSSGLQSPNGLAVDSTGNLYIADTENNAIKKWDKASGDVTTIVSGLNNPTGVAVNSAGNMYIADIGNNAIKEWSKESGTITTAVYSGLRSPSGVAVDSTGNVYIADYGNNAIKKWDKESGNITIRLSKSNGVAVDSTGNVYIADYEKDEISKWDKESGIITTLLAGLSNPAGVAVDSTGNVYIADTDNGAIKKWNKASGIVTTLVSSGLNGPSGLAVDSTGNVYIANTGNYEIKKWNKESGIVTTIVFGLNMPTGVAVDSAGNVYIADTLNDVIKKLDKESGIVTTIVSGLNLPSGVAVDNTGNIYISDRGNNAIKKITALAAPTASPAGAALVSGTKVILSSATAGADIYYTVDGSIPTTSSTRYTEPITVSSEQTIKAIAVKSGMIDSNVMSESYTVVYTINAQSSDLTLGTVGKGGTYAAGAAVTLTAEPRMGCKFVKWTSDAEGNTQVSTNKTLTITVSNSSTYYAWFTLDKYTLTVGDFNSLAGTVSGVKEEGYSYNEAAALTAEANAGYAFQGWKNQYGVTVATSPTISFDVLGNITITPVFTQIEASITYYTAAFYHQAGNLLKSEIVAENSTITPPSTPSKSGYDFIGWSIDEKNPVALNGDGSITITSNMIFKPLFRVKEVNYTLTVNDVIQGSYAPLSSVTAQVLDVDIEEGKQFAYWSDRDGNVVSYSNPYNFSITGNIELTAVYENSTEDVIKNPTLTLSTPAYEFVSTGKHKIVWYAAMDLPEGYTLVESGILRVVSETPQTNEQMTFDSAGIYRRIIQVSASIPNQYYYSVTATDGKGVSVRAYIVLRNKDGNLETIFSDVQHGCYVIK